MSSINVKPLDDRLVIQRDSEETTSVGGIILPESAKETPLRGTVVKAGPGKRSAEGQIIPLFVKEGDRVIFGQYAGTKISLNNEEYLFMKEEDILAVEEA